MKRIVIILLASLLLVGLTSHARMIVKRYSGESGLPHNAVHSVIKDSEGFVWIGGWYGLSCFDGVRFKNYNSTADVQSNADIPPRKIQYLAQGEPMEIWVKTIDHKLYLFDKRYECYYSVSDEIKRRFPVSTQIIKLEAMEQGVFLLLTINKDLLKVKSLGGGKFDMDLLYDSKNRRGRRLRNNILIEDATSIHWVGMDNKILSCPKGRSLRGKSSDFVLKSIALGQGVDVYCASIFDDVLWLGDTKGAIYRIDYKKGEITKPFTLADGATVHNILSVKADDKIVVQTSRSIVECNTKSLKSDNLLTVLPTELITGCYIDSYNMIWLEINQREVIWLNRLSGKSRRIPISTGQVNHRVKFVDGHQAGLFILSLAGDIYRIERSSGDISIVNDLSELSSSDGRPQFFDMYADPDGGMWLGSSAHGVIRISFPKQQFFKNNIDPSREPFDIKAIAQCRNGDIWLGGRQSEVYRLNSEGKILQRFGNDNYRIGALYHIMEDSGGNIWFSTKGDGLVLAECDPKSSLGYRFTRFVYDEREPLSISGNDIYYTYEDSHGTIWVASFGGGLNMIESRGTRVGFKHKFNSMVNYPPNGLYTEVRNIVEDKSGRLWVGTTDGLMSIDISHKDAKEMKFDTFRYDDVGQSIFDNDIYAMLADDNKDVWLSVFGSGLCRLTGYDEDKKMPQFKNYGMERGLASDIIFSIAEDSQGYLWVTTEEALSRFDKKSELFRNYDRYDGLDRLHIEEASALSLANGSVWFGTREGVLTFNPRQLAVFENPYKTFIVDLRVQNKSWPVIRRADGEPQISIRYASEIALGSDQSMFTIEFAALNYYNQGSVSYKYILEGYEKQWHYNGRNRIASYTNVPPGKYRFRVQPIDESNVAQLPECELEISILPPWWRTWWAYIIYLIFGGAIAYFVYKLVAMTVRMRNDMYIEHRVSELKIRFFTNISHELRTPLTLIKGPLQEIKKREKLSQSGEQCVQLMEKSANQMLQLVNQILDLRKIQNGKMTLKVSYSDLNRLVESVCGEFEVLSQENDITFHLSLSHELIEVWIDREKMKTVIRNLLSNAFKFTSRAGTIEVTTGVGIDGKSCYVRVEDSGVGIPKNQLTAIFERFAQADVRNEAYYQGTGIGLALSRDIVKLHKASINVDSVQGQGSIFTVELLLGRDHFDEKEVKFYLDDSIEPYDIAPEQSDDDEDDDEQGGDARSQALPTLLFVDDNSDLCKLLRLQLSDRFNVCTASNGEQGLSKIRQMHPDIVVTDQMMPTMDGFQMLKFVRSDFQISHIPVIVLSAKSDEHTKIEAVNMGANAYITKPFNIDYLIARIDQLLLSRNMFREHLWNMDGTGKREQQGSDGYADCLMQKDIDMLNKTHKIIEENLDNCEFNIDIMASTIGLSRSSFFKKIKSLTGLAPVDLVKQVRLNKSIELLKSSDMTISEVAFAVGFMEPGYYGKCFRKRYGQTPREYINQYRKI